MTMPRSRRSRKRHANVARRTRMSYAGTACAPNARKASCWTRCSLTGMDGTRSLIPARQKRFWTSSAGCRVCAPLWCPCGWTDTTSRRQVTMASSRTSCPTSERLTGRPRGSWTCCTNPLRSTMDCTVSRVRRCGYRRKTHYADANT